MMLQCGADVTAVTKASRSRPLHLLIPHSYADNIPLYHQVFRMFLEADASGMDEDKDDDDDDDDDDDKDNYNDDEKDHSCNDDDNDAYFFLFSIRNQGVHAANEEGETLLHMACAAGMEQPTRLIDHH